MTPSLVLVLALCVPGIVGYGSFRFEIPNGEHVPHPCKPNFIWHGVGHQNAAGGGARNPFGLDFAKVSHRWSDVCGLDSDGDGMTNGQELGDPTCIWTPGSTPSRTTNITHPGVCDPWDKQECKTKNTWVDCSSDGEFACDYINDPDVLNITIRFPRTKVPAKETSYICFNFELPKDREYHLIATKPIIDNPNVMHHMGLTACDNSVGLVDKPFDCMMGNAGCLNPLSVWTLGMNGECFHPEAGFRIGKGASGMVSLQHHWTNPREIDTWYDSSGLVLYYTPKLRRYDASIFTVGQTFLNIPPRMPSVVHEGTCTSQCTKTVMKGPIHVVTAMNHMHYLGTRQNVTLTRAGMAPVTIMDDNPYSYDSPKVHEFSTPLVLKPGDEVKTYCTFQSRSRSKTTMYGAGSYDEMCFAFMTYFPAENLTNPTCVQWKDTDFCDMDTDCYRPELFNSTVPSTARMIQKILDHCDPLGECRPECPQAIKDVLRETPCMEKLWDFMASTYYSFNDPMLMKFVTAMESCDNTLPTEMTPPGFTPEPAIGVGMPPMQRQESLFLNIIKQLDSRPLLQNIVMNVNYNNVGKSDDNADHTKMWH